MIRSVIAEAKRPEQAATTAQPSSQPPAGVAAERARNQQQFRRVKRDVHGWVVLDKPVGMTSTHAVGAVKRLFQAQARGPRRHARSARLGLPADRARRGDQDRPVRDGRPQDLPLHRPLGRGARHRRRRRPGGRDQRPRPAREAIEALLPPTPAPSRRCRRAIPPSRSRASAPTTSPATARWSSWTPGRSRSTGSRWLTSRRRSCRIRRRMRQRHLCALARPRHGPRARLPAAISRRCAAQAVGPFGEDAMISLEQLTAMCHRAAAGEG